MAVLARGHVLLEGVPGLGKTKLVQTLCDALHLKSSRIQFTPDLMPADIVGTNVVRESESGEKHLDFQPGPIFANVILADEINRATPKTQSALLEAMQEKTVTVGRKTYKLEEPFIVLATLNPLELEATYALPEAQLDRFFLKLKMNFPDIESVHTILDRTTYLDEPAVDRVWNAEKDPGNARDRAAGARFPNRCRAMRSGLSCDAAHDGVLSPADEEVPAVRSQPARRAGLSF
jgi:MoxR-like ATPase